MPPESVKTSLILPAVHWSRADDVLAQAGDLSGKVLLSCSLPMDEAGGGAGEGAFTVAFMPLNALNAFLAVARRRQSPTETPIRHIAEPGRLTAS